MRMPETIHFHHDETPLSAASRLAAANGYSSLRQFLIHIDLKASEIKEGSPRAIERLSQLSGIPSQMLSKFALRPGARGVDTLGKAKIRSRPALNRSIFFCPACAVEDRMTGSGHPTARPYQRYNWGVPGVVYCSVHHRSLCSVPDETDFARALETRWRQIVEWAETRDRVSVPSLETYISRRIAGEMQNEFLDGFELYVVQHLCSCLGDFMEKRAPAIGGMDTSERGFTIAQGGENSIEAALIEAIEHSRPSSSTIRGFIGPIVDKLMWNARDPFYKKLVDMVQDVSVRRLPFGPGQKLFNPVTRRFVHSVHTATREYRLTSKRVRATVVAAGLVADNGLSSSQMWFDAAEAHPFLEQETGGVPDAQAAVLLGIDLHHLVPLRLSGVFNTGKGRKIQFDKRVHRSAIEDLKNALFSHAMPQQAGDQNHTFAKACLKVHCDLSTVVKLARDGLLASLRSIDESRLLSSYRVDPKEVRAILTKGKSRRSSLLTKTETLRYAQVGKALGVRVKVVRQLVEDGHLPSESQADPYSGHTKPTVSREVLEKFLSIHIRLPDIADQLQRTKRATCTLLQQASIPPKFDSEFMASRFYLKSDIVGFLERAKVIDPVDQADQR